MYGDYSDFSDKILVAVGDSFVYGHLGDDLDTKSCHNRSWVKKLEILGKFKSSINLGLPGGSNQRSYRVLMDYLNDHGPNEDYFVMFGTTDIARFELPINKDTAHAGIFSAPALCPYERPQKFQHSTAGPWSLGELEKYSMDTKVGRDVHQYISLYYSYFYHEAYQSQLLEHYLTSVHLTLEKFNIEHCFVEFVGDYKIGPETAKNLNINLPVINYYLKHTREKADFADFMRSHGYNPYPCHHYDHDGNQFVANYFLWKLSKMREQKNGI